MIDKKIYNLILTLFLSSVLIGCQEEKKNYYKIAKLKQGSPELLRPIEKDLPFEILSYSLLNAMNDSIDLFFGQLKQGNTFGNWVALAINDELKQFSTIPFKANPEHEKDNNFDIDFNHSKNKISFRIKEIDTANKKVTYSWLNKSGLSDSLIIFKINNPLQTGEKLPDLDLKRINGEKFNIAEYKNQVLVINWWAVWCSPCREEIPGLNQLAEKYATNKVKFIAITDDPKEKVLKFLETHDFDYEITFVTEEDRMLFGNSYPINIVTDSSGTITYYSEGANEYTSKQIEANLIKQIP